MMKHAKVMLVGLVLFQAIAGFASTPDPVVPKNIIFVIVDGMGSAQVDAAEIYLGDHKVRFREFPYQGTVTTHNFEGAVTDSAAAGTAMATGQKVSNGVLSQRIPGDASPLKTMLERAKEMGKSTGLVTTDLLTGATPAAFGAHTSGRTNTNDVLNGYFSRTLPNVVFGADEPSFQERVKTANVPYLVATTRTSMLAKTAEAKSSGACIAATCPHIYGGFGSHPILPGVIDSWKAIPIEAAPPSYFADHDIPHLSDMASSALSILSQNQDGFFLMVESGLVDWIGHRNRSFSDETKEKSSAYALGLEFKELNKTLDVILKFLETHPDTLVILTADHETGGLVVKRDETTCLGQEGCLAKLQWTSALKDSNGEQIASHTGVKVGVYAIGRNSHVFANAKIVPMDNTEFVSKIFDLPTIISD